MAGVRLVRFTLRSTTTAIWINPAQVVAVIDGGDFARIVTTATGDDGPKVYAVDMLADQTVTLLEGDEF